MGNILTLINGSLMRIAYVALLIVFATAPGNVFDSKTSLPDIVVGFLAAPNAKPTAKSALFPQRLNKAAGLVGKPLFLGAMPTAGEAVFS